jgi:hypothetical protein
MKGFAAMSHARSAALAALVLAFTLKADNYSQWGYFKNIVLNSKATGANVTNTVRKIPLLIRLTSANAGDVFDSAQASGQDIRFAGAAGKHLPYQIERWNKASKLAEIWVLADSVKGNDSSAAIAMYWGMKTASDSSSGPSVFDTANGFQAVYHLSEPTGDTAYDATINHYNGVPKDTMGGTKDTLLPADTTGMIGRGKEFNGSTNGNIGGWFACPGTAAGKANFPQNGHYTFSCWTYINALTSQYRTMICKNDKQWTMNVRTDNKGEFNVFGPPQGWQDDTTKAVAQMWNYVTGVRDSANEYLYLDSALITPAPANNTSTNARVTTTDYTIGRQPTYQRFWTGKLDEIRVENVTRNADWVRLCYKNQVAAQALVMLGMSMPNTPSGVRPLGEVNPLTAGPRLAIVSNPGSKSILFRLTASSITGYGLRITDLAGRTVTGLTAQSSGTSGKADFVWNRKATSPGLYIAQAVRGVSVVASKEFFAN